VNGLSHPSRQRPGKCARKKVTIHYYVPAPSPQTITSGIFGKFPKGPAVLCFSVHDMRSQGLTGSNPPLQPQTFIWLSLPSLLERDITRFASAQQRQFCHRHNRAGHSKLELPSSRAATISASQGSVGGEQQDVLAACFASVWVAACRHADDARLAICCATSSNTISRAILAKRLTRPGM
jgi:hypothetical protein